MFHHRQQHASGGFGVGLGVVVVKLMADVRCQGVELVVWQVRPDALGDAIRAKIIKLRTGQAEMIQGGAQTPRCRIAALCAITMSARVSRSKNSGAMAENSGAS